ncbi:MAG: hypothetical protein LBO69_06160 [Ignavibacteria bacterium]|jgi:hypothetical protein|nr:hypothetical protein [Ignavibacteria bacterium]
MEELLKLIHLDTQKKSAIIASIGIPDYATEHIGGLAMILLSGGVIGYFIGKSSSVKKI